MILLRLGIGYYLYLCKKGLLYLTVIIDLYDRKLTGWSLNKIMATYQNNFSGLAHDIKNREVSKGFLFHSNQGVQYATNAFANMLELYKEV